MRIHLTRLHLYQVPTGGCSCNSATGWILVRKFQHQTITISLFEYSYRYCSFTASLSPIKLLFTVRLYGIDQADPVTKSVQSVVSYYSTFWTLPQFENLRKNKCWTLSKTFQCQKRSLWVTLGRYFCTLVCIAAFFSFRHSKFWQDLVVDDTAKCYYQILLRAI